jgi:hypothetical protein
MAPRCHRVTRQAGCQKATTELCLRNSQSPSHLRYPMDTHQLTSSQGEADGVSDGGMTLQALGGEFALRLVPRQRAAPFYRRTRTHTHTQAKNAYLNLFCLDSGRHTDQSRMTDQALSGNGQHQRWGTSGEQQAASEGSGWQQGGSRGAAGGQQGGGWRH